MQLFYECHAFCFFGYYEFHSFFDNDRIDMFYKLHIISLITLVSGIAHISEASWSSAWEIPRCACSDIAGDYYTPLTGLRDSSILCSQQRSVWALDLILENVEVWTYMPVWASMWWWKYSSISRLALFRADLLVFFSIISYFYGWDNDVSDLLSRMHL